MNYFQMQEEIDKNKVFDQAVIEQCADDFFDAYEGDETQKLPPVHFWRRWEDKFELPELDLHDFFIFFRQVIALANEKRGVEMDEMKKKILAELDERIKEAEKNDDNNAHEALHKFYNWIMETFV